MYNILKITLIVMAFNPLTLASLEQTEYSRNDLESYFITKDINYFKLKNNFGNDNYKLNSDNRFQVSKWYTRDWFEMQKKFLFRPDEFSLKYFARNVLQAKENYYKELSFNFDKMRHVEEISYFKEWGILNHPPIIDKIKNLSLYHTKFSKIDYEGLESSFFKESFHKEIDNLTGTELSFNNKIQILEDKKSYIKKIELIKSANSSILMSSLVFVCDSSTTKLVDELIKKSLSGVKVYILADKMISTLLRHKECPEKMKRNGIKVILANDFLKYEGNTIYHNKKLVTDLKHAIVGGQNMLNADNLSNGTDFKNRDIDVYTQGPIVTDIASGFIDDYKHFYHKRIKRLHRRTLKRGQPQIVERRNLKTYKNFLTYNISAINEQNQKTKRSSSGVSTTRG